MLGLLLLTRPAAADPVADLEKAHNAYVTHSYDEAEARLRELLDNNSLKDSPDSVADARMYLGAVLVEERKKEEADEIFEKLLLDKPAYTPDPLRVSSDAIDAFLDAQTRLRDALRHQQDEQAKEQEAKRARAEVERARAAARLAMLERLASEERVVEKNSRWVALLPFGVGQFQNRENDWGWVFLSAEGLLAVGSVVGAVVSVYEEGQARDTPQVRDDTTARDYQSNAYKIAIATDALAGGFLLVAVAGAIQAEVRFVPEIVHTRKRALPSLSLSPLIGPGGLGLAGRF